MKIFNLPDLGEGLPDAEIVAWHVAEGDKVVTDQPLVSVETDKAVVEVPAPFSGRVAKLHGKPGDLVQTGHPLVELEEDDRPRADRGTVVGAVEVGRGVLVEGMGAPAGAPSGVRAIPAVRALARRLNVDLSIITPSGADGSITRTDVERAASALAAAGPAEPLRGVRRAMARRMALAHGEVPPATVCDDADIDAWAAATDVTMRLVQAIAAGCRTEPSLNAWYDGQTMGRRVMQTIDLGIAVDTEDGLFVPVLRNVGRRDAADLRRGLDAMKADVLARSIPPDEMRGYTFILSNFGNIGGRYAAPIVLPPCVAILGAGRIRDDVVAIAGKALVHRILPLSLTFDHRAVTGGEAARFLVAVIEDLERPS